MKQLLIAILTVSMLCGCTLQTAEVQTDHWAMDTYMNFKIWGADAEIATEQILRLLTDLEDTWSAADKNSFLSRLNRGEAAPTAEQQVLLDRALALSQRANGAFDPRLNSAISLWGFLSDDYRVPDKAELSEALQQKQWNLGASIKGYAGQQAAEILSELKIDRAILNLGGNVQTYGEKEDGSPWQIAIQNPTGGDYIGVVSVTGTMSVVTSGDYQRYFEQDGVRYHHILDPKTGCPADSGLASVTVICRDGMTADALSTALFVMGLERGTEFWRQSDDFEAVFILTTGEIYATQGAALSGCEYEVISREK